MGFLGVSGPKELLATSISAALDEFFVVDPKKIESNLLKDAKIVLKNVCLQPQRIVIDENSCDTNSNNVLVSNLTGVVEEVRFSWAWDISSNVSWVKDSNLTIKGLRFKARLSYEERDELKKKDEKDSPIKNQQKDKKSKHNEKGKSKLTKIKEEGALEAYVRNQVENIIDALHLVVIDFKFTLELPSSSGIHGGGEKFEIKSLGRSMTIDKDKKPKKNIDNILKQELFIHSLYISVFSSSSEGKEEVILPLMEAFSYQASATRHHGKRFSSFSKSVEFWGKPIDGIVHSQHISEQSTNKNSNQSRNSIRFHAGIQQIQILSQLGNIFLEKNPSTLDLTEKSMKKSDLDSSTSKIIGREDDIEEKDDQFEVLKKSVTMSSTFRFLAPGISLVLENKTQITLESFDCYYNADGTVMRIVGTRGSGILVDNYPLVATNESKEDSSYWMVDFITSTFSIERTIADHVGKINDCHSRNPIACVRFQKNNLKKVYEGLHDALISSSLSNYDSEGKSNNIDDGTNSGDHASEVTSNWSIEIKDTISIHFERGLIETSEDSVTDLVPRKVDELESICFSIDSPSFTLDSQVFTCNGITSTSNPLGSLTILVPNIVQAPEQKAIYFDGDLSITLSSLDDLNKIYNFFEEFDIREKETSIPDNSKDKSMTQTELRLMPIAIPFIKLIVQDSDIHVIFNTLNLEGDGINIDSLSFQYGEVASASLLGIAAKIDHEISKISIRMIDDLNFDDTFVLLEPITHSTITYNKETIAVNLSALNGQIITRKQVEKPMNPNESSNISIPFPVLFQTDKISIISQDKNGNHKEHFEVSNFSLDINTSSNKGNDSSNSNDFIKLRFDEMHSDLMKLPETELSSFIDLDKKELSHLSLTIPETIYITIGHSSLLEMVEDIFSVKDEEESTEQHIYKLPLVKIGKLHFEFSYDAKLISGKGSKLEVAAFNGTLDTSSDDLIAYYHKRVIKQVPGLIRDSSLLGANIVDTTLAYGSVALSANPYTAVFGVLGLDAIVNTLDAGRKSRGADRDEFYKVGDLTRGLKHCMDESTKAGVKMRSSGENDESIKGNPLDFFVGASTGVVKYVDNNKSKLGGAGGAGTGIMIGTVMGGPIGGIVGGIIGGAVTSKVIAETEDLISKKKPETKTKNLTDSEQENDVQIIIPHGPQGLLFTLGGIFEDVWEPFWYILDIEKRTLLRYRIIKNAPPKINRNKFTPFNLLGNRNINQTKNIGEIQIDADPSDSLELTKCEIEKNDKFSSDELQRFAFTITFKKNNFFEETYHFFADTEESRLMWVAMIADMTGNMKSLTRLLEPTKTN